jgi:uncharacterized protein
VSVLEEHAGGVILNVRAHAGARRNAIGPQRDGHLQVSVTQAPEKGKANRTIIALLADELGLRKSQFELIAGETSPQKRFLVREITRDALAVKISGAASA